MRKDLTDITLVVDRSGSMETCRSDAEGGVNSFVKEQKGQPGDATLTLVQFDTDYEFVHNGKPIKDVGAFKLVPRGWTALLDAVGRSITEAGARLEKLAEADRPGCVIFVIVTDGLENSSREFTLEKVREMIEHQQKAYNWQFTFLGANAEAFAQGTSLGIRADNVAQYAEVKTSGAFRAASSNTSKARKAALAGSVPDMAYSAEQRASIS